MISTNGSNQPSATKLVSGILGDFQDLMRQQFELIKAECRADWQKSKEAGLFFLLSLVPVGCGVILLAFMLAHLLHWLTSPADADPASLPLWGCYGIVGACLVILGVIFVVAGWSKARSVDPMNGESVKAMEENVHWLKGTVAGGNRLEQSDPWAKRGEFRAPADHG